MTSIIDEAIGSVQCTPPSRHLDAQMDVVARLGALYHDDVITKVALAAWRRHIEENRSKKIRDSIDGICNRTLRTRDTDYRLDAVERFLTCNPIRVVDTLGRCVSSLFFTGPHSNTIVMSAEVRADPRELTFLVLHMFMHYFYGHTKHGTYDMLAEFRRDSRIPSRYLTTQFGTYEAIADDAACCIWDDYYSPAELDRSLVRAALAQPHVTTGLLRSTVRDKHGLRSVVGTWLHNALRGGLVRRQVQRPTLFRGPVALVKAPDDIRVYLLYRTRSAIEPTPVICRRWVPSGAVLTRLGKTIEDVIPLAFETLQSYPEAAMLIDPQEVNSARRLLKRSTVHSARHLWSSPEERLRGILNPDSDFALEHSLSHESADVAVAPIPVVITPLCREVIC